MPALTRRIIDEVRAMGTFEQTGYYGSVCELFRCLDATTASLVSYYWDLNTHVVRPYLLGNIIVPSSCYHYNR